MNLKVKTPGRHHHNQVTKVNITSRRKKELLRNKRDRRFMTAKCNMRPGIGSWTRKKMFPFVVTALEQLAKSNKVYL